jgi:Zn-dependent protease
VVILNWIVGFLLRLVIVPFDLLMGRRRKVYSGSTVVRASRAAVWDHLIAEELHYEGMVPYIVRQRRRPDQPDILDAEVVVGDASMKMVLRELENDGGSRIVAQVLKEGTDPALYLGRDYIIATEIEPTEAPDAVKLTITYSVVHETLGGRFNLPLSLDSGLRRIKTHVEKVVGTYEAGRTNAPLRDALVTGVLTLGSFAILFDAAFAAQLVFILLLHELGHVLAMRWLGMPVKGIYFVPFMGAVAVGQTTFGSEARRGFVALMGPAASMITSALFMYLFATTGDQIWRVLALMSIILNGFNLIPVLPLDGGQILSALLSRAPATAQRVVQLALLAIAGALALQFEAYITLTFVGIVAFFLAVQKPSPIRLQPIEIRAAIPLTLAYLATFAFYVGAGLWLVQLGGAS